MFDTAREKPDYWFQGYLVKLTLNNQKVTDTQIIPYTQQQRENGFQVQMMQGEALEAYQQTIAGYSKIIQDRSLLQNHWQDFVAEQRHMYYSQLLGLNRVQRFLLKKDWLTTFLLRKKRIPVVTNLFRCQAHRRATVTLLEQDYSLR